jgi:hypothetical protein
VAQAEHDRQILTRRIPDESSRHVIQGSRGSAEFSQGVLQIGTRTQMGGCPYTRFKPALQAPRYTDGVGKRPWPGRMRTCRNAVLGCRATYIDMYPKQSVGGALEYRDMTHTTRRSESVRALILMAARAAACVRARSRRTGRLFELRRRWRALGNSCNFQQFLNAFPLLLLVQNHAAAS